MNYGFVSFDTPRLPCLCVVLRYVSLSLSSLLMRCTKYHFRVLLLCTYVHTKTDERTMQLGQCVPRMVLVLLQEKCVNQAIQFGGTLWNNL